jgi:hypothetical protein
MDTTQQQDDERRIAGDVLIGATRIAEHISVLVGEPVDEDDVYYFKRVKKWPIGKHGAELIASRKKLNKHADRITRGNTAA